MTRPLCLIVAPLLAVAALAAAPAPGDRTITTLAGTGAPAHGVHTGPLDTTPIEQPFGMALDRKGRLIVCSYTAGVVYRVDLKARTVDTIAGTGKIGYAGNGGPATEAQINDPHEVVIDPDGNLYLADMKNHAIRRINAETGVITTLAGTGKPGFSGDGGPADKASLNQPHSVALDAKHNRLYIADLANHRIRCVDLTTGVIDTIAGTGEKKPPADGQIAKGNPIYSPRALFVKDGVLWIALREGNSVWRLTLGSDAQAGDEPKLRHVAGTGKKGYTGDGGSAMSATFSGPKGIAVDHAGLVYLVDTENHAIRVIDPAADRVWTLAGLGPQARDYGGDNGPVRLAKLNRPHGILLAPGAPGGRIYIGDSDNHRVRVIAPPAAAPAP